eukprot:1768367-Amphidinium_carterae.1
MGGIHNLMKASFINNSMKLHFKETLEALEEVPDDVAVADDVAELCGLFFPSIVAFLEIEAEKLKGRQRQEMVQKVMNSAFVRTQEARRQRSSWPR